MLVNIEYRRLGNEVRIGEWKSKLLQVEIDGHVNATVTCS